MARHIHSRLKIIGELIAETPLHVGGYGESFETDMALARNGKDEFYVPGTSLTGTLRNWFKNAFGESEMERLFGNKQADFASFVLIEDLTLLEQVQTELRDGAGIDRCYGTAADKAKFDRAILPKGTKLNFEMIVEIQNDSDKIKARFVHLLEALQNGNIRLGASKTRGLGKVTLQDIKIKEDNFIGTDILKLLETEPEQEKRVETFDSFKTKLQNVPDGKTRSVYEEFAPPTNSRLEITIKWKPKSALMVKAGYEGIGVDMVPLTSGNGKDKVSLCLPGSSIKGAFRSHAERILRTLLQCEDKSKLDCEERNKKLETKGKDIHEQIKLNLVDELFGARKERAKDDDNEEEKSRKKYLGLGVLSIDDCYAERSIDTRDWQTVGLGKTTKTVKGKEEDVTYTEQELWQAIEKVESELAKQNPQSAIRNPHFAISHHVAIDRWTGGASEGALYSVLQPTAKIDWEDICLTLDLSRLPDVSLQKKCLMLLLLVLRDFAENRLPLGFATNRGMGEVKEVSFKTSGLYEIEWKDGKFDFKNNTNLKTDLETEWGKWQKNN